MDRIHNGLKFLLLFTLLLAACSVQSQALVSDPSLDPTRVVVRILDLDAALTTIPTEMISTPQETPPSISISLDATPTADTHLNPASTQTQIPAFTATASCSNRAEFIAHLTVSNNTALESAQPFTKIWQIKNSGTCTWTEGYSLVFFSGEDMSGPESTNIGREILPGETIDIRVELLAPITPESHTGYWVLRDEAGNLFGVGDKNDQPISVTIFVKPTPKPPPS